MQLSCWRIVNCRGRACKQRRSSHSSCMHAVVQKALLLELKSLMKRQSRRQCHLQLSQQVQPKQTDSKQHDNPPPKARKPGQQAQLPIFLVQYHVPYDEKGESVAIARASKASRIMRTHTPTHK